MGKGSTVRSDPLTAAKLDHLTNYTIKSIHNPGVNLTLVDFPLTWGHLEKMKRERR
jgi:hypothetical protein